MVHPRPANAVPGERLAIFIDGWNFRYATYESFRLRVDYLRLLDYFRQNSILIRAYFYTGEWDSSSIDFYIRMVNPPDPDGMRQELEEQARSDRGFWRFLNRNGYKVIRKTVRVQRQANGSVKPKADLDLELAVDMLNLAERCDKQVLISGDGDFVPLVEAVQARGVRVVVVSTQSPDAYQNANYRASDQLLDVADEFVAVESIRQHVERDWTPPRVEAGPGQILEGV